MNRRNFLHTTLSAAAAAQTAPSRPNILLFRTDQQRFDTIRALDMDKLVESGVTFLNAY